MWTEDEAKRGSEEVGSGLLAFLEAASVCGGRLILWSDGCGGHNKNFYILCLWQYLIAKKSFESIHHKFPETGHSYLDSDRDFAKIEKEIRCHQNIYSVDEYQNIMVKSQSKANVQRLSNKFVELKKLPQLHGLVNRSVQRNGRKVYFRDIRWICVDSFGTYKFKLSHRDEEPWETVNILKGSATPLDVSDVQIPLRLSRKSTVNPAKVQDIKKQLPFIPSIHRHYYEKAISLSAGVADEEADASCDEENDENDQPTSASHAVSANQVVVLCCFESAEFTCSPL